MYYLVLKIFFEAVIGLLVNGLLEVSKLDERTVYKGELNERNFVTYCTNNLVTRAVTFTSLS